MKYKAVPVTYWVVQDNETGGVKGDQEGIFEFETEEDANEYIKELIDDPSALPLYAY